MLIIPAIDIQSGSVVRLYQGATDKKIYSRDPLKTAKHWLRQGAELIHVVDLDGAFSGEPKNIAIVKRIVKETGATIEFGGGVRSIEAIKELLACGIQRVVLGTKAIEEGSFLKKARDKFKDRVIVSIDAREGRVMTKGWKSSIGNRETLKFACALAKLGFKEIIYTDISKDGTMKGPNIMEIKRILKAAKIKVIASGGISSLNDIYKLRLIEKQGVSGAIIGKALYEGRFTLKEAIGKNQKKGTFLFSSANERK
ncbi:MAG: 1-(5-phosphoribosyl)-5-[(5-phosphoribosylamino)methylideneamino]imidazole-4-carboxamide isomerase [Candidatus Omnitrophica bacterium]|nr:1-(5-phosphoribosyl)-5-[(5-phosphoribosylamino)methylideneamino]imidazole-4-carboxamide isomerase [Candidatus Omnitrophota bacterium]